ncbi:MAG TPA: ABC transporter permease [Thermoanaerobaculia bacterium]|nr:ABC transporter permease [Thermoanaerobaculia bacterium]
MTAFFLRRVAQAIPLLFLVATLIFSLIHWVPGDPAETMLGEGARPADLAELRSRLGLDRPLGEQYLSFLSGLLRFDLGRSLAYEKPVTELLAERLPRTFELALAALAVALIVSLPLGCLAAIERGKAFDVLARGFAYAGTSIPSFWLGPVLILVFAIELDALPVSGRQGVASLILPALTLGLQGAAMLTRMVRTALADELGRPYLRTARAKGLPASRAVVGHGLRNALIPVVTVVGLQFGSLLTGSIVTETIFSWPGVGSLLIQAIRLRDYPLVVGSVLLIAVTYVLVNLATDLLYGWLDPRVRARS